MPDISLLNDESEDEELARAIALSLGMDSTSAVDGEEASNVSSSNSKHDTGNLAHMNQTEPQSSRSNGLLHTERVGEDSAPGQRKIPTMAQSVDMTAIPHHLLMAVQSEKDTGCESIGVHVALLYDQFKAQGQARDLEEAIGLELLAVQVVPDSHSYKAMHLTQLVELCQNKYFQFGAVPALDQAISAQQQLLALAQDGHPNQPSGFAKLGNLFRLRFEEMGDIEDIDQSILSHQQAVVLTFGDHVTQAGFLSNLGASFARRFQRTGRTADIDQAIDNHRQATDLIPAGHPNRAMCLANFGQSLDCRFQRFDDPGDMEQMIVVYQEAKDLFPDEHPQKHTLLNGLGRALRHQSKRSNDFFALEQSILAQREAIQLVPDGHPEKPEHLNELGISLDYRFTRIGDQADINEALDCLQQATSLTPNTHPNKPLRLCNLGNAYSSRFERTGELLDSDRAISTHIQAVALASDGHFKKPTYLNALGVSYMSRFQRTRELRDINQSILVLEQALALTPQGHADKPMCLTNLGNSLELRFQHLGDSADLAGATTAQQQAVYLTPDGHPDKPERLINLGRSLYQMSRQRNDLATMKQSVAALQEALPLTTDTRVGRVECLLNLGGVFMSLFLRRGAVADIHKAISFYEEAGAILPEDHHDRTACLFELGNALVYRHQRTGSLVDIQQAISSFRLSAISVTGNPSLRFKAAERWAQKSLIASNTSPSDTLEAYSVMINLIPQVVWLGRTIHQRYEDIASLGTVIGEAATMACQLKRYTLAIEWLEQGRSIVWGQILHLRAPVDLLQDVDHELASRLRRVAQELEIAGATSMAIEPDNLQQTRLEESAQAHRKFAFEWEDLLKQARSIPGFEEFLQPKPLSKLVSVGHNDAIVVVNINPQACEALVLPSGSLDIQHILLNTSFNKIERACKLFQQFLQEGGARQRGMLPFGTGIGPDAVVFNILSMLWMDIARPILDRLGYLTRQPGDLLPKVTWCLTGPLTFLPVHAAGLYRDVDTNSKTFNYAISTYTPGLTALAEYAQSPRRVDFHKHGLLAVLQSHTQEYSDLPGATAEVTKLEQLITGDVETLGDANATVDTITHAIEKYGSVHFACHAIQDAQDPTKSGFILHDGKLELGSIMKMKHPRAELAYLSACQTAMGDENLSEEAIHLAAGMFIAGYPSVIATMWSIGDQDGPQVAEAFYRRMLRDGGSSTAEALHWAVSELRESMGEDNILSWAPFIHVGC